MKKIVLIPDSFKGTMSSREICAILAEEARKVWPEAETISIPVADGGEGSVDAFLAAVGGKRVEEPCKGPYWEDIAGFYGRLPGDTAVVEMAAAAGLPLAGDRLRSGAKKVIVGLGGSATNDGGAGMAAALGVRFLRRAGEVYVPTGGTLEQLERIDLSGLDPLLEGAEVTAMCDIDNPLCGPAGASAVFGPQKGADQAMVERLDRGLGHLAAVAAEALGRDLRDLPGAGAAGGMGFGMAALLGSRLQMGIDTVLDAVDFAHLLEGADLVITGEGRIDSQSLRGKVVVGVARRAKASGVPVAALVGDIGEGAEAVCGQGVTGIFSTNRAAIPFAQARLRAKEDMRLTAANLFRFLGRMGH